MYEYIKIYPMGFNPHCKHAELRECGWYCKYLERTCSWNCTYYKERDLDEDWRPFIDSLNRSLESEV